MESVDYTLPDQKLYVVRCLTYLLLFGGCRRNDAMLQVVAVPPPGSKPLHFDRVYARNGWSQFTVLLWKLHKVYWRSPSYNLTRMAMTITIALLFGAIFWGQGIHR